MLFISISPNSCIGSAGAEGAEGAFSPQSMAELKSAVDNYLEDDGNVGPNGPIGECDVSCVTDMSFGFVLYADRVCSRWGTAVISACHNCDKPFVCDVCAHRQRVQ